MNRCISCGVAKKKSAFGHKYERKNSVRYLRTACKKCRSETEKARYRASTESQKLAARDRLYRRLYGITLDDYQNLFARQAGKCLGCEKHQSEFTKLMSVDHHHESKKVRALLCAGCNLAIGNVKENAKTLINLASYLERSE